MKKINKKLAISLLSLTLLGACGTPNTPTNNTNINQSSQQNTAKTTSPVTGNVQINKDKVTFNISLPKNFKVKYSSNMYVKMSLKSSAGDTYYPVGADDGVDHLVTLSNNVDNISVTFNSVKYDPLIIGSLEIYREGCSECRSGLNIKNITDAYKAEYYATLKTAFAMNSSSVSAKIDASTTIAATLIENVKEKNPTAAQNINVESLQNFVNTTLGVTGTSPNLSYSNIDPYNNTLAINKLVDLIITANGNIANIPAVTDYNNVKNIVTFDKTEYKSTDEAILTLSGFDYDDIEAVYTNGNSLTMSQVMNGSVQDKTKVKVTLNGLNSTNNQFEVYLKYDTKAVVNFYPTSSIVISSVTFSKAGNTIYVNKLNTSATKDGNSWSTAYSDLQEALNSASSGDSVWVATGTNISYHPGSNNNNDDTERSKSFIVPAGVKLYGGFSGSETLITERTSGSKTTLSGDLNDNDIDGDTSTKNDNSYTILRTQYDYADKATIDGFIISDASGGQYGGGIYNNYSSPILNNVILSNNSATTGGGGMYNDYSSPTMSNVAFSDNTGTSYGGGVYNNHSSPTMNDVTFSNNKTNSLGGGMYNNNSSPIMNNITFSNGSALNGGGMYNTSSSPTMNNVTFSDNSSYSGGGIYNEYSSPTMNNVVFSNSNATGGGGGMYNNHSSPTMNNAVFSNNAGIAGGIYNKDSSSNPVINFATFSNSSVYIYDGIVTIKNSILYKSKITNENTLVIGNTGLYTDETSKGFAEITNAGTVKDLGGSIITNQTEFDNSNYSLDPMFDTLDGLYGLSLSYSSPYKNKVSKDVNVDKDILGNLRTNMTAIGAYEFNQPE